MNVKDVEICKMKEEKNMSRKLLTGKEDSLDDDIELVKRVARLQKHLRKQEKITSIYLIIIYLFFIALLIFYIVE